MPNDDDEDLWDKLRKIRQKQDESYIIYEARMEELFRRLQGPVDEKRKLRVLMEGLHFYYRSRIQETKITSTRKLRKACRELEPDKSQVLKLERERERDKNNKERQERVAEEKGQRKENYPSYYNKRSWNVPVHAAVEEELGDAVVESQVASIAPGATECWRCGKVGDHFANKCKEKIYCQVCGHPDVIAVNCKRCFAAYQQGLWRSQAQQNFQIGAWSVGSQAPVRFPYPPPPVHYQTPNLMQPPPPSPDDSTPALTPQRVNNLDTARRPQNRKNSSSWLKIAVTMRRSTFLACGCEDYWIQGAHELL